MALILSSAQVSASPSQTTTKFDLYLSAFCVTAYSGVQLVFVVFSFSYFGVGLLVKVWLCFSQIFRFYFIYSFIHSFIHSQGVLVLVYSNIGGYLWGHI